MFKLLWLSKKGFDAKDLSPDMFLQNDDAWKAVDIGEQPWSVTIPVPPILTKQPKETETSDAQADDDAVQHLELGW